MISKKVHMNDISKSSFSRLVSYMTDSQEKANRIGDISITNCHSDNLEWAKLEIKNTQLLNVRAKSDKTYHLLISFPPGENVDKDTLSAIEDELCSSLGYSEHQRISVVHHDTDNLHIHVAINKVHPTRLTLHEPYNDYYIRNNVCSMLEDKYNLQKDNHVNERSASQNAARDMEKIAGIESLITYISKLNLNDSKSWAELHSTLNDNGLEIKLRGNGLVFENIESGLTVKSSSVGYSKSKLEKKLGIFTPNKNFKQSSRTYRKKPIKSKVDTTELFLKYKQNNANLKNKRNDLYKNARLNRDRLIQEAKDRAKLKRTLLKNTKNNPFKKILYKSIYSTLLNDIQKIKKSYNKEILAAKNMKPVSWLQWLQNEAKTGNKEVLSVLRSRNSKSNNPSSDNSIYSEQCAYHEIIPGIKIDNVTKNGNIIYNVADSKIKDTGAAILTSSDSTKNGLAAAILMAKYRYGQNLTVNGNDEFKRKIANIVVEKNINVNFSDPNLEKYKNELLGDKNEHRTGTKRHRESPPSIRSRAESRTRTRTNSGQRKFISRIINIGRIVLGTIAVGSHNMRKLSECNMASIERRSKVLLQTNERDNLENNRTGSADTVRRNVDSGRVKVFGYDVDSAAILAANKYIEERNEKAKKMFDIKKHIQYNELDSGSTSYSYNGIRYINGQPLALFETDNNSIAVVPVSKEIENKLRKCSRGTLITINKSGGFNIKQNRRKR
ncbi:MAG: relaxase/mobilization nuclease domain-containing protein [Gilliamella sp.]|nr:relaxase/mobilization nuclease domain-containing protein [Gilliamella sp.]